MRITNKNGLPEPIANFAEYSDNRKYSAGGADYSATTLIDSPRIHQLMRRHRNDIEKDVTEAAFTMLGSAMHLIWERGAGFDHVTEERLFLEVLGKKISGQIDLQEIMPDGRVRIIDFKVSSVWAKLVDDGLKKEWVEQLNIYAYLLEQSKGVKVETINICVLFRDWSKAEAGRKAGYPPAPIELIELPLWSKKKRKKFLEDRVRAHKEAEELIEQQDSLPLCTDEERWARPGKIALMRTGRKRAIRLFKTEDEAMNWCAENGYGQSGPKVASVQPPYYLERRDKTYIRCESWCPVAQWCTQLKAEKVFEQIEKEDNDKQG